MAEYSEIIAKKIAAFLKENDLSQAAFGAPVGLDQPVVNRALKGKLTNPEYETLAAIGRGMGLEVWELLKPTETHSSLVLVPDRADPRREILVIFATLNEDQLPAFAALARGLLTPVQTKDVTERLKRR